MIKVMCAKAELIPAQIPADERVFSYFKGAKRAGVGTIANRWHGALKRGGFRPSTEIWDFVQFCLAVCSADLSSPRRTSADGWTRNIQLTVGLCDPDKWLPLKSDLEDMLKVLTGDYWLLNFNNAGMEPPQGDGAFLSNDCVSLLSGGLDSLIGGIDLVTKGQKPLFVSQLAHKDSELQRAYAAMLMGNGSHYQWSHGISFKGSREPSTRGRSLAFYAFALLASTKINQPKPTIFIPENGVISINPPLVPGRVSSLSTRTTHPMFIDMLQRVLDTLGINVQFQLPYRFKTKGEMMRECLDQELLQKWAADSTSCGRFRTYNRQHCGRCVPCLIRRAAFLAWKPEGDTTSYRFESVVGSDKSSAPDDPMAVALAILDVRKRGLDRFLGGSLAFAPINERPMYRRVLQEGIKELETVLTQDKLL